MLDYHREQVAVKDRGEEVERKVADGCRIVCVHNQQHGKKEKIIEQSLAYKVKGITALHFKEIHFNLRLQSHTHKTERCRK